MLPPNILGFDDSEVSSADLRDNTFVVLFSAAYIHRADGASGFVEAVELTIHHAIIIEKDSGCVGRLSQGSLRVAGTIIKHVPIPYEAAGSIELELAFANGSMCKVIGERITLEPAGEARVMEWLKC